MKPASMIFAGIFFSSAGAMAVLSTIQNAISGHSWIALSTMLAALMLYAAAFILGMD